ncbi:MAG: hypothetical protein IJX77_10105 [Ruminococcus sp.]|nr:hypothetical protein [Ruminococcus sp.]
MKKALTLFLASMMILTLAGCGDKEKESSSVSESRTSEEITEAPEDNQESDSGSSVASGTIGQTLLEDFKGRVEADASLSAQELADAVLTNGVIQFAGASMPVENGLLTGFGNAEITGFSEGVMFAPTIGTIPFVGYVFTLDEGTDAAAFVQTLKGNADPRWNICTEADETIVENIGDKVFFLMCPSSFEE